ncbi:cyanoexosortase B system-associated protein [Brunnivagina elsteri]|uniref:Cyanoexosortase B system-associated protein n=1 Tax=Brunnivagina elsteri CCALA 953 TaxID=987040 RepID=A0A2A2TJV9_9CYAN|nr:cyanoexosortase B system-associated protein [Calothrix elsteri]PAX55242.1 cyanoexosortase B system-associated protein [Calothrix elsteri CCALA 953]
MISLSKLAKEYQYPQLIALLLLILLLFIGTVPGYLTGKWQWKQPPPIPTLKELKQIRKVGLTLPGWQTVEQQEKTVGDRKWSLQTIQKEASDKKVILLMLPQNGPMDQPQVEWMEVKSFWQWEIAQERDVEFTVKALPTSPTKSDISDIKVKATFFRGSTKQQSFAVLQWYAWANGGDPSQLNWFLADQSAQWQKHRAAWVAVNIAIPMEQLGQVDKSWEEAKSLGETIQTRLISGIL